MVPKDAGELRRTQWKIRLRAQLRPPRATLPAHCMALDALRLEHLPPAHGDAAHLLPLPMCIGGAAANISDQVVHFGTPELRPVAEIHVNEIRSSVVSDTAPVKGKCGIADHGRPRSWQTYIDGLGLHVQAVLGNARGVRAKILVAPRCPIAADDLNLRAGTANRCFQIGKQIKQARIVVMNVARAMIAYEMIHLRQRLGNVVFTATKYDVEPLASMSVIEPEAVFGSGGLPGFSRNGKAD